MSLQRHNIDVKRFSSLQDFVRWNWQRWCTNRYFRRGKYFLHLKLNCIRFSATLCTTCHDTKCNGWTSKQISHMFSFISFNHLHKPHPLLPYCSWCWNTWWRRSWRRWRHRTWSCNAESKEIYYYLRAKIIENTSL